ncbi:MAG: TolC family protein [Spirochaetales bacterium]|nr:TolC family protein [Spirochaetales bacterium]
MNRKIMTGLLGMMISAGALGAQETLILTEEGAVEIGMTQNLSLRGSALDLASSEESNRNRWNSFLPSFSASAGISAADELFSDETMATSGDPWSASFGGSVTLPLGLTNYYAMESAALGYDLQSLSYEYEQSYLESTIRKQFSYLLASRENVLLQEKSIDLARKRYEQAQTNYLNGLASELTVLQAQNSLELLRPAYQDVQTAYENQLMSFKNLLGMDLTQEIELQGTLDVEKIDLEPDVLVNSYLAGRLDVQSSQKSLEIQENQERMTKAASLAPSLALSAGWNNSITSLSQSPGWSDTATLSMNLSIPLDGFIPGSADRTSISNAGRSTEKSSIQVQETMNSAEKEIRSLVMTLEGAWTNIETSEASAELALRTFQMTEQAYNQGTAELLDVEDAQNKLLSANQDLLLSRYSYLSSLLDLELALNTDLALMR